MKFPFFRKKQQPEERALEYVSVSLPSFCLGQQDVVPMALSAVFRAVTLISDSLSVLPFSVKQIKQNNKNTLPNHPLNLIFSNRSDMNITWAEFIKMLVQETLLHGNGFAYIYRNGDGSVKKLRFLRNGDVIIDYNEMKDTLYYKCTKVAKGKIEPVNMIHLKKFSYDGINGISVVKAAWKTLKLATAAEQNAQRFFDDGLSKLGYIQSHTPVGAEQKQQIVSDWASAYGNSTSSSRIAVLPQNLEYKSISVDAADAQLLETRQFSVEEIARFFGVSPVLLGDLSNSSYSTIEASLIQFLSQTLKPYIALIEQEFTKKLLKPSESNLIIDIDDNAALLTDKQSLANYYQTLLNCGVYSINEVRSAMDMSEIENGDEHYLPFTDLAQNNINQNDSEINNSEDNKDTL